MWSTARRRQRKGSQRHPHTCSLLATGATAASGTLFPSRFAEARQEKQANAGLSWQRKATDFPKLQGCPGPPMPHTSTADGLASCSPAPKVTSLGRRQIHGRGPPIPNRTLSAHTETHCGVCSICLGRLLRSRVLVTGTQRSEHF